MEKSKKPLQDEVLTIDFEIPEDGNKWTPSQLAKFDYVMRNDKIPKPILTKLLIELKDNRTKYGDDYPVSNALGYVFNVVIDKNLGNNKWRGYTPDWKQEMRDRAIELLIKHSHNFDPIKMNSSKNADPYYYLGKIVFCAFIQAKEKLQKRSKRLKLVQLNEAVMSNFSSMDEFVITTNNEIDEQERREKEAEEEKKKHGQSTEEALSAGDDIDFASMSDEELAVHLADNEYSGD